jgi:hypothetical protein
MTAPEGFDFEQFTLRERAWLGFVKWSLAQGHLSVSEWAVRDRRGVRLRIGFDRRVGPPTTAIEVAAAERRR